MAAFDVVVIGAGPGGYIAAIRAAQLGFSTLEAARIEVEARRRPLDEVARLSGFGDTDRMRAAFLRAFGQPPQALRRTVPR